MDNSKCNIYKFKVKVTAKGGGEFLTPDLYLAMICAGGDSATQYAPANDTQLTKFTIDEFQQNIPFDAAYEFDSSTLMPLPDESRPGKLKIVPTDILAN